MSNVVIKSTAIYHPERMVKNEELVEEFKGYGKDIAHFLDAIGRKERYLDNSGSETSLSMAIKATENLLKAERLSGSDVDMIVFTSGTPEYTLPSNVSFIHKAIQGKNECIIYDLNANCVGMVVGIEQTIRAMKSNPRLKKAIVVGSEHMGRYAKREDEINRGVFGDGACAVLLESVTDKDRGFIDSVYHTDSDSAEEMLFPACGMSKAVLHGLNSEEVKIFMKPGYQSLRLAPAGKAGIEHLLKTNGFDKSSVKAYFVTQVSSKAGALFSQLLNEPMEKFIYVGDRYGYTGTSSPLFALHHAYNDERLKTGDLYVVWSVGAGQTTCGMLFRK